MSKTTHLDKLDEIVRRLVAEFSPEKIILFGSHAWGKPEPDSDIDILVVVKQDDAPPSRRAARAYKCMRGLRAPVEIIVSLEDDLRRYESVRASLSHKIVTQGKVLYG
ncbi:MAG: nucleotidyltransferase domain-containing protein [bacterium]